ncbi:hypothetical protein AAT19DRAFT_9312 [Rhodotorula toruloides]|uniref:Uncharacterized protein n=1 Tax=Rhodotorula toruloides TaxID=5286 RepID=A0A2T0A1V6_RHOTO|nr:hypothetical protein AAT19DRAFT_9312 [Rhodotorula toruloides]
MLEEEGTTLGGAEKTAASSSEETPRGQARGSLRAACDVRSVSMRRTTAASPCGRCHRAEATLQAADEEVARSAAGRRHLRQRRVRSRSLRVLRCVNALSSNGKCARTHRSARRTHPKRLPTTSATSRPRPFQPHTSLSTSSSPPPLHPQRAGETVQSETAKDRTTLPPLLVAQPRRARTGLAAVRRLPTRPEKAWRIDLRVAGLTGSRMAQRCRSEASRVLCGRGRVVRVRR